MTKQECIQQAYGEYWSSVQYIVDENGWIDRSKVGLSMHPDSLNFSPDKIETICEFWRPLCLQGISDNNGWTKIESEADLPENFTGIEFNVIVVPLSGYRTAWFQGGKFHYQSTDSEGERHWHVYENVSHYKPVKIEPLPLY